MRRGLLLIIPLLACGELLNLDDEANDPPNPSVPTLDGGGSVPGPARPGDEAGAVDGGDAQDTAPPPDVRVQKRVFLSDNTFPANVGPASVWDGECQRIADAKQLGGGWSAWISTTTSNAVDRVGAGPWYRLDGVLFASSKADFAASPQNPIIITERGTAFGMPTSISVWTGTNTSGTFAGSSCVDWTSTDGTAFATVGSPQASNVWTQQTDGPCDIERHIYCFEHD